jgi:hypothetical protein
MGGMVVRQALKSLLSFDETVLGREGELAAALWMVVISIVVIGLGVVYAAFFRFTFDPAVMSPMAVVTSLLCGLAASPFIRLLNKGWFARYDEIRNSLSEGTLHTYLLQFWEERVCADAIKNHVRPEDLCTLDGARVQVLLQRVYDSLYHHHYGLKSLALAIGWLIIAIFFDAALATFLQYHPDTKIVGASAQVSLCAMAGAYIFAVGDGVLSIRQRKLNVSDVYWYAIRMMLAIPIGVAATGFPSTEKASVGLAFAIGLFPVDRFLKFFRRLSLTLSKPQNDDKAARQLMKLEGVSATTATLLEAEGVSSVDQLATMDPVLLAIRTGLPFSFILHLGSQAVVWRHLGENASKLTGMALGNAEAIARLLDMYTTRTATTTNAMPDDIWAKGDEPLANRPSLVGSPSLVRGPKTQLPRRYRSPYFAAHPGANVPVDAEQVIRQAAERLEGRIVAEHPSALHATLFRFHQISSDSYTLFLVKVSDEKEKALATNPSPL